jgi:hypothetical protein
MVGQHIEGGKFRIWSGRDIEFPEIERLGRGMQSAPGSIVRV